MLQTMETEIFSDPFVYVFDGARAEFPNFAERKSEIIDGVFTWAKDSVAFATTQELGVPVEIQEHSACPALELNQWDQVIEVGIELISGELVVAGMLDYLPSAARLKVKAGSYRLRIRFGDLDEYWTTGGWFCNAHYQLLIWPSSLEEASVLKSHSRI